MGAPFKNTLGQKQHRLIYNKTLTQDLFTTPLDITGLDGDKWDYLVELESVGSGSSSTYYINFNNDTSANYRSYSMQGRGSSALAQVDDSATRLNIGQTITATYTGISRFLISGDSSSERYVDVLMGGENSLNTYIQKLSGYWKDTVSNLTSMQLSFPSSGTTTFTIRIYQVPKQANLDNYDLIDVVEFTNRSTDIVFSGLNGDVDEEYLIQGVSTSALLVHLNDDKTTARTKQNLFNANGAIGASDDTPVYDGQINFEGFIRIDAESGRERLTISSLAKIATANQNLESVNWYPNTVDNITSISISNLSNDTGTIKLYKRKSNRTIDPVPMRTVVEYDIAGVDFSNGITITGIEGDRIDGAIKFEFIGSCPAVALNSIQSTVNGSNPFTFQQLAGRSNQVIASGGGNTTLFTNWTVGTDTCKHTMWFYPKSGKNRPAVSEESFLRNDTGFYNVRRHAVWFNNSVDEVNSFEIFSNNTNLITGKIIISVPRNTKQATGSWQVTVN